MKNVWIASALLAGGLFASQAQAIEKGDWLFRVGATGVYPESTDSGPVSTTATGTLPGTAVGPDDAWSLGLTIGYALTNNLVLDVLAAWPFKHNIESNAALATALGSPADIGEIKQLPPTVSLQYYFMPKNNIRPFVGAGINYFYAFDEKVKGPLATAGYTSLDVDDSWGFALQAGVDFDVNDDWFVTTDLRWIDIEVDATATGGALGTVSVGDITVDPWVFSIMVGTRF